MTHSVRPFVVFFLVRLLAMTTRVAVSMAMFCVSMVNGIGLDNTTGESG